MDSSAKPVLRRLAIVAAVFVLLLGTGTALFVTLAGDGPEEAFYRSLGAFTTASFFEPPDTTTERAISAFLVVAGGLFYLTLVGGVVRALLRRALPEVFRDRRMSRSYRRSSRTLRRVRVRPSRAGRG